MFKDRPLWYLGFSSYWFASSLKWLLMLLLLPGKVAELVPEDQKNTVLGTILAVGAIQACIGPWIMGTLSDKFKKRLVFLWVGSFMTVLAVLGILYAPSILALQISFYLLQIADDIATGPYAAMMPQVIPLEHRGSATGTLGAYQALANLAGAIALTLGVGTNQLLLALCGITLLTAGWVHFTVKRDPDFVEEVPGDVPVIPAWKTGSFQRVWFTRFCISLGFSILVSFGVNFMDDAVKVFNLGFFSVETGQQATGVLALALAISGIPGALLGGKLVDKRKRKRTQIVSGAALLMAISISPYVLVKNFAIIAAVALIFGFFYGIYNSSDFALATAVLPESKSAGRDLGIWQAAIAVPQLFNGAIGSMIDRSNKALGMGAGYSAAFLVSVILFCCGAVLVRKVRLPALAGEPQSSGT